MTADNTQEDSSFAAGTERGNAYHKFFELLDYSSYRFQELLHPLLMFPHY